MGIGSPVTSGEPPQHDRSLTVAAPKETVAAPKLTEPRALASGRQAPNSQPPLLRGVFLDRDGVLNEAVMRDGKPYPPAAAEDVEIIADALAALERLKARGLPLIVVTNQPDVARGAQTAEAVRAIHDRIRRELPVDDVLSCFHDDTDRCLCRKPEPGLILDGAVKYGIDPRRSFMIGDRWRDIDAGKKAGCRTIWIDRGYRERGPSEAPDVRVDSLNEAVTWILRQIDSEKNGT